MKHFVIVATFTACLLGANVFSATQAAAAGVNCSFDACMKACGKNRGVASSCSSYCSKTIQSRTAAGQCK
jgi:hypothetical protein